MRKERLSGSCVIVLLGIVVAGTTGSACDEKPKPGAPGAAVAASATASALGAATPVASAPSAPASAAATGPSATTSASAPFVVPDAIAAQHILVAYKGAEKAPKGITRSKPEAKKRAEEVATKAKSGTDFSSLVAEYSDDPAAKERQGSLGKFTREKMAKPFSDAAFQLRVDESSAPVETPFGFHVIKRNQ
jgi:peptidyl-prolyl cis-trans isomerase NIMA-interacting 1